MAGTAHPYARIAAPPYSKGPQPPLRWSHTHRAFRGSVRDLTPNETPRSPPPGSARPTRRSPANPESATPASHRSSPPASQRPRPRDPAPAPRRPPPPEMGRTPAHRGPATGTALRNRQGRGRQRREARHQRHRSHRCHPRATQDRDAMPCHVRRRPRRRPGPVLDEDARIKIAEIRGAQMALASQVRPVPSRPSRATTGTCPRPSKPKPT